MNAFREYWSFSAIRGAMTLVACAAIFGIPYFARAILPLPLTLDFAIDCLAAYTLLDAAALILIGTAIPGPSRRAIFTQVGLAVILGGLLFAVTYGEFRASLMWIVAAQAAIAAVVEWIVAGNTYKQYGCLSCYATPLVLAACAISLPFASGLGTACKLAVLAGFVGLYGFTQLMLGARMLFLEYRAAHPAAVDPQSWRLLMNQPLPGDHFPQHPAQAIRPYVVPGHGGRMIPGFRHAA